MITHGRQQVSHRRTAFIRTSQIVYGPLRQFWPLHETIDRPGLVQRSSTASYGPVSRPFGAIHPLVRPCGYHPRTTPGPQSP